MGLRDSRKEVSESLQRIMEDPTTRSSCRELRWSAPSVLTRRFPHVKWIVRVFLLFLLTCNCLAADNPAGKDEKPKPARSIDELRQQIEKILKETHTNGVSIAIVHKGGPEMGHRLWHGRP